MMHQVTERESLRIEVEQAVLGAVLFDHRLIERIDHLVDEDDFYDPYHRCIWSVCLSLYAQGKITVPAVAAKLLERTGDQDLGRRYLEQLIRNVPSTTAAPDYASTLREMANKDRMLIALDQGKDMVTASERVSLNVVADDIEQIISQAIKREGSRVEPVAMSVAGNQFIAAVLDREESGMSGPSTGIRALDAAMGGLAPALHILAGRPSMGKTAAAMNLVRGCAADGGGVYIESAEMGKAEIAGRFLADMCFDEGHRINYGEVYRGRYTLDTISAMKAANSRLADWNIIIRDLAQPRHEQVAAGARRAARTFEARGVKLSLIVIDYLQIMGMPKGHQSPTYAIGEITAALKALQKELDCHVLVLSQLSRQVEQREDKRPMLSDLRDSGSIEQDADIVSFLYRAEYYLERSEPENGSRHYEEWLEAYTNSKGLVDWIFAKYRNSRIGKETLRCWLGSSAIRDKDYQSADGGLF